MGVNDSTPIPDTAVLAFTAAAALHGQPRGNDLKARRGWFYEVSGTALDFLNDAGRLAEQIALIGDATAIRGKITHVEKISRTGDGGSGEKGEVTFEALSGSEVGKAESITTDWLSGPFARRVYRLAEEHIGQEVLLFKTMESDGGQRKFRTLVNIHPLGSSTQQRPANARQAPASENAAAAQKPQNNGAASQPPAPEPKPGADAPSIPDLDDDAAAKMGAQLKEYAKRYFDMDADAVRSVAAEVAGPQPPDKGYPKQAFIETWNHIRATRTPVAAAAAA